MALADGEIKFFAFYFFFIGFVLFMVGITDFTMIENLTQEQYDILTTEITMPEGFLDLVGLWNLISGFFTRLFVLTTATTGFALLSLLLTSLSFIALYIIISKLVGAIRGN